jgi:dihydrofolate reductase
MGTFRFQLAVSLDGYVVGPDQSEENPLGVGGLQLHQWVFPLEVWRRQQGEEGGEVNASTPVVEEAQANVGAVVMGRNMFGGGPGPWPQDPPWTGWWGEDPPFHTPVFVLTHHPRSGTVSGCSRTSATSRSRRCARSRRPASPTSSTASSRTSGAAPLDKKELRSAGRGAPVDAAGQLNLGGQWKVERARCRG